MAGAIVLKKKTSSDWLKNATRVAGGELKQIKIPVGLYPGLGMSVNTLF